ncbi:hypothetical protein RhiirA1_472030 [Rhizophagus irregularis]|uniref:Uncharacterized protein n=2 Tax=Rhizophagus irregularis TaxID=588596 RepID=A0A2I1FEU1_9GLOM|nr:hypothetical protein RhiirA1_472030 [Rhizophagus irregularis]PKY32884.1 hypothetical protein RhiirB3_451376 [Rhizophagus irregularis]GBC18894.1 hypothetical protein GLOIN_2v1661213 [Rhizophagus irregularis DAOM 181602=DAOM 197198]CAG8715816.1 1426_t:CDS:2 [Rhizophagus irregularis]
MLKTLMNRFAKLCLSLNVRTIKLYGVQVYAYQVIVYEFKLQFSKIYTVRVELRFSIPKTWKDMKNSYETVIRFLKLERLLCESSTTIKNFLWSRNSSNKNPQMMTRMLHIPKPKRRT